MGKLSKQLLLGHRHITRITSENGKEDTATAYVAYSRLKKALKMAFDEKFVGEFIAVKDTYQYRMDKLIRAADSFSTDRIVKITEQIKTTDIIKILDRVYTASKMHQKK